MTITVVTFLSALAFPGNRTHDLGVASAMLYYLSYRKAVAMYCNVFFFFFSVGQNKSGRLVI